MKHPYDTSYQPSFPAVRVVLHNSEERLRTDPKDALLDTSSDGTLVPIVHLQEILAPPVFDGRIRSHWGEWRSVQLFPVDIELDGLRLTDVFVVGDDEGDEIVLGRDILNQLRLLCDGPAGVTEILL